MVPARPASKGQDISKTFKFLYEMTQGGKNIKLAKVTDPRGNATSFDYYLPSEGDGPKDHWPRVV